jgi:hypothetical protein
MDTHREILGDRCATVRTSLSSATWEHLQKRTASLCHFAVRILEELPPLPPSRPPAGARAWARPAAPRCTPWRAPRPGAPWTRHREPSPSCPRALAAGQSSCGHAGCWLRVTDSRPPHAGEAAARACVKRSGTRLMLPTPEVLRTGSSRPRRVPGCRTTALPTSLPSEGRLQVED